MDLMARKKFCAHEAQGIVTYTPVESAQTGNEASGFLATASVGFPVRSYVAPWQGQTKPKPRKTTLQQAWVHAVESAVYFPVEV
jgi:hypothetical protein